jgi:hypothetical protein
MDSRASQADSEDDEDGILISLNGKDNNKNCCV